MLTIFMGGGGYVLMQMPPPSLLPIFGLCILVIFFDISKVNIPNQTSAG